MSTTAHRKGRNDIHRASQSPTGHHRGRHPQTLSCRAHAADELGRPPGGSRHHDIGYGDFLAWAQGLGHLEVVGIEGVGHYGAGLGRAICARPVMRVTEVGRAQPATPRPPRQDRQRRCRRRGRDGAGRRRPRRPHDRRRDHRNAAGAADRAGQRRARARAKAFNALKDLIVTAPGRAARTSSPAGTSCTSSGHAPASATSEIPSTPAEAASSCGEIAGRALSDGSTPKPRHWTHRSRPSPPTHAPRCARCTAWPQTPPPPCSSPWATTPNASGPTLRSPNSAGSRPSKHPAANRAAPTQQRRKPRRQPRPARHLRCSTAPPPTHPRLPRPPHRRRQDKGRNHALHKEIHRPRDLPRRAAHTPRDPYSNPCRNMRASGVEGAMMASTMSTQRWPSLGGSTWPAYPAPGAASATRPRPRGRDRASSDRATAGEPVYRTRREPFDSCDRSSPTSHHACRIQESRDRCPIISTPRRVAKTPV